MTTVSAPYRTSPGLTDAALDRLAQGRYAVLGTVNPDGSAHLVPVMYRYGGGSVDVETSGATRKARNVAARPLATVLVLDDREGDTAWVSGRGPATLVTGEAAQAAGRRIRARYLTERGEQQLGSVLAHYDDVVIRVTPDRWLAWDMSGLAGTLAAHGLSLDDAAGWYR